MKSDSSEKTITWTTSQVVLATLFVVCVFLTFWLLYQLRLLIFLLFAAIVLGTAIRPAVEWLQRRGISRMLGVILVYLLIAGFFIGFLALTFPLIADQATQLSQTLPEYYSQVRTGLIQSDNQLFRNVGFQIPTQLSLFFNRTDTNTEAALNQVTQTFLYANVSVRAILSVLAVFLLAYYWTQESNLLIRTLLRLVPLNRRHAIQQFLYSAEQKIGGYLRGQGILSVVVGAMAFVFYTAIGLPYTLVLALIAGVMELVPVFGPALGAIPALLVALTVDSSKAVWVLIATGAIQTIENVWLVPRVMKNSTGVNPIVILLSLAAFGSIFGLAGALLALPLAAIFQLIMDRFLLQKEDANGQFLEQEADVMGLIDESQRLMHVFDETSNDKTFSINEIPEADRSEIKAIAQELDQILQQLKTEGEAL